jgi:glycosyltransferase involved in cell wall biosynthesis
MQGGTSNTCLWLSYWLSKAGWQVHIVTTSPAAAGAYRYADADGYDDQSDATLAELRDVHVNRLAQALDADAAIPRNNPLVTRLAATALDVASRVRPDLVMGVYLEPYGLAAYTVAEALRLPFALMHAGSDIGRLARLPDRSTLYKHILRGADLILSSPSALRSLIDLGVDIRAIDTSRPFLSPQVLYGSEGDRMNVRDALPQLRDAPTFGLGNPGTVNLAAYGKLGRFKATHTLVRAVGRLRAEAQPDVQLTLVGPAGLPVGDELWCLVRELALEDHVTILPFISPWRLTPVLRGMDVLCSLETGFPIDLHRPVLMREAASLGKAIVVSSELANRAGPGFRLVDGQNCVVVDQPDNDEQLASGLSRVLLGSDRARLSTAASRDCRWPSPDDVITWTERTFDWVSLEDSHTHRGRKLVTLADVQRLLGRVYADRSYRNDTLYHRRAAIESDQLSPHERGLVEALLADRTSLERFCESLLKKRWRFFESRFSSVLAHRAEVAEAIRKRFFESWILEARQPEDEIVAFTTLAHASIRDTSLEDHEVSEIERELAIAALRLRVLSRPRDESFAQPTSSVRLPAQVEFVRFASQEPDSSVVGAISVVDGGTGLVRVFESSESVFDVLTAARSGLIDRAGISDLLRDRHAYSTQEAEASIDQLVAFGLIVV